MGTSASHRQLGAPATARQRASSACSSAGAATARRRVRGPERARWRAIRPSRRLRRASPPHLRGIRRLHRDDGGRRLLTDLGSASRRGLVLLAGELDMSWNQQRSRPHLLMDLLWHSGRCTCRFAAAGDPPRRPPDTTRGQPLRRLLGAAGAGPGTAVPGNEHGTSQRARDGLSRPNGSATTRMRPPGWAPAPSRGGCCGADVPRLYRGCLSPRPRIVT